MANKNISLARNRHNRGVALVTSLLLLTLFTVMTLSMVIATTSDTLIDGYYRNARGSFYASDSGINAARQYLINQFQSAVPNPYTPLSGVVPIATGTEQTTVRALETAFGSANSILGTQTASWPGKFQINYDTSCDTAGGNTSGGSPCPTFILAPTCTAHYKLSSTHGTPPSVNVPTCTSLGSTDYQMDYYYYSYPYKLSVTGQSVSGEKNTIEEQGAILATIQVNTSANQNFAAWGMFIDQYGICNGSTLVPGTISGPVFTNGAWTFGTGGSYIFTDPIASVSSNFGYQFGSCYQSNAATYTSGGQTINPTFRGGFNLGQQAVALPTDSFNQKEAVVDGIGTSCSGSSGCPSTATLNAGLRDINGGAFPTSGASGVFLGYTQTTTGGVTTNTMTGGGILVEGNAGVTLTASTSGSDNVQVYTITQGSTTTTVTVDITANTTKVVSGAKTTTIQGVPANRSTSSPSQSTMLYVDGTISSLSGPSSGAAVQDGFATTVAGSGDINITGNILYKTEPVTLTTNQIPNTPADTLIPGNNNGQALGIFTANGNVNLNLSTSGQNLEIDASVATISQGGSGGIVNTGQAINNLTIVGGRIQNTIQNINASTRNVWFDRRFAQGGFAPPFFPSTTLTTTVSSTDPTVTASRVTWVNTSAQ